MTKMFPKKLQKLLIKST